MFKKFKIFGLLLLVGFLNFSNGLDNPMLIDDHAFMEEKLMNIKFLPMHFIPDKNRAFHIEGESADPFYRPLSTVVPMLSILVFKYNVVGHHCVNLILLCMAGLGIYLFLGFLGAGHVLALLAAVFYIIHPINGVAVNYITASVFSVQVMLMLGALYFFRRSKSHWDLTAGAVLYFLSALCHETAIFLPLYLLAMHAVIDAQGDLKERFTQGFKKALPAIIMMGVILFIRVFFVSTLQESILEKIKYYHMDVFQYLATWTMLLSWYISRLFWFQNVVLIMAHQPLQEGVGLWLCVLAGLIVVAGYLLWQFRSKKLLMIGLLWFLIGFFPFTLACFFQPIHGLMIEPHWFLFSVIGFFMVIAGLVEGLLVHKKMFGRVAVAVIVACSIYFSRWHNWVWGDEIRYCTFWLNQSPSFVAVNAYLAKAYEYRKEFNKARAHYKVILDRGYKSFIAYTNLGLMDLQEGQWDSAKVNFQKVLKMDPRASVAVNNLGVIYFKNGDYDTALKYFKRAKELNRFMILPYLDISKTYVQLKNPVKAIEALEEALEITPGQEQVMVDLIQIYIAINDKPNIVRIARMMAKYSSNPYTLRNAGFLLRLNGHAEEGEQAALKAKAIFGQKSP